jgi:hypothetical protein
MLARPSDYQRALCITLGLTIALSDHDAAVIGMFRGGYFAKYSGGGGGGGGLPPCDRLSLLEILVV